MKPKKLYLACSLTELNGKEKTGSLKNIKIQSLVKSAEKLFDKAKLREKEGDEEDAYLLYMRYFTVAQEVRGRNEYKADRKFYDGLLSTRELPQLMAKAEQLSSSLEKRYQLLQEAREAEHRSIVEAPGPEPSQQSNAEPPVMTNGCSEEEDLVSVAAVFALSTRRVTSFLLVDVRPQDHYAASHTRLPQSLNIPQHILNKGLTGVGVGEHLDAAARMLWGTRGRVDKIFIMDWNTEALPFPAPITVLIDAITEWDPSTRYTCRRPLVVQGGYELLALSYPHMVTAPCPSPPYGGTPTPAPPPTLNFDYPDLDTTFLTSPPPAALPSPDDGGPGGARSPQVTPRSLDAISHPVYPSAGAKPPTFSRSLKPPQHILKVPNGAVYNGVGPVDPPGPPSLPPADPAYPSTRGSPSKGATSLLTSMNGQPLTKGYDVGTKSNDMGPGRGVVPQVPSRALKPLELLDSLAGDNMIEEKRLLEATLACDQRTLDKLGELERGGADAATTASLRQELRALQADRTHMEAALERISRENKDLWARINSFVSDDNNNSNNNNNSSDNNSNNNNNVGSGGSSAAINGHVRHTRGDVSADVPHSIDEKVLQEVLATKKATHEQLMAQVQELRRLRKLKEQQIDRAAPQQETKPGSGRLPTHLAPPSPSGGVITYHSPLRDSPDLDEPRGSSNLRRSHSAFDLSQIGESLSPAPQRKADAVHPLPSASSALHRGMKNMQALVPSIDRSIKPLQSFASRTRRVNAARKRDFGPMSRTRSHTGLKNLGNTCYMNAIVQCLCNTQPFAAYFVEERHTDFVNPNSPQRGEAAIEFGEVVKALKSGKYQSVAMKDFKAMVGKYNPEFRGNDQHDAHEFLMNLADWLHDDLNLVTERRPPMSEQNHAPSTPDHVAAQEVQTEIAIRDQSVIRKLFYGLHRNVITCLKCGARSLTFEPFFVITLSFPANGRCSLMDLLQHYYQESTIEYTCSTCRCLRESVRKMDIWALPPVLIIHLNRFEQRDFLMTKNPNFVDFPLHHLRLDKFVVNNPTDSNPNTDYSLYAVCNHYGTIDGGHYTAFCSSWPPGDSWHKYDDHEVYDLPCTGVKTSAAYVLCYQSSTYVTHSLSVY
ncbi:ubiquitin carboxyl-terminal hydrolase 8 [Hyalella azteca]|uniref:ubiquitinyl hydrolase 1 n=1 Tax=Hyalella azteca TaxID=294128 RepID=A0A8B7N777_HYAAZ|nr:ubiquitin carboxyl-terminal hydrolase 8 [Hyalella azteca]